jgi:phosphoribosylglycinamide formyltransferase-1
VSLKIVLFAYSFPHRKTIDFIEKLYEYKFMISVILAADYINIKSPKSAFKLSKKNIKQSTSEIAKKYNIPIHIADHNSVKSQSLLKEYNVNFGIISGARILNIEIIQCLKHGVLNFHPGLLPKIRGLDSILWSIHKDYPLGVTAHLINEKIDSGIIIKKQKIKISINDNLDSLYEKIYQLQLYLLPRILNLIFTIKYNMSKVKKNGKYNHKMSYDKQVEISSKMENYIKKYSNL